MPGNSCFPAFQHSKICHYDEVSHTATFSEPAAAAAGSGLQKQALTESDRIKYNGIIINTGGCTW